jgi:peptide/nickel transport system substrate-binding protein
VEDERREARRRRRRRRDLIRVAVEVGAFSVFAITVVAIVAVVLQVGKRKSEPPRGTLVVSQSGDFASLDPALASTREAWELEYATCAKLLDYPPRGGVAGTRLVPEVARSLPRVSRDRRTYVFRVRDGLRFSDGSRVTARSFARALERARAPELLSPAEPYLREVAWWKARVNVLTIHLRKPAPDFLQRLALPYFCAVPASTPAEPTDAPPSAGPLYVARHVRGRSLLLLRNPYYAGPRRVRVAKILYRFGAFPAQIRLQLERGEADYGVVPPSAFESLATKLAVDRRHLFAVRQPTVAYLALNTQRPLFRHNPQLRRAVNFALDRLALARQFGVRGATPTDQYLPPGSPGFRDARIYPTRPDVATARRLARGHLRGGHAVFLSCGSQDCKDRAVIVAANLRKIGLRVEIRATPGFGQFTLASVKGTSFDIADVITRPDYGDPYGLVEKLLDGRVIRDAGNTNVAYFDDAAVNRAIDEAQRLRGAQRIRAYGRLDVQVARREAPLAAYANLNARVFLSTRVACITYQPVYGLDIASLCLRGSKRG